MNRLDSEATAQFTQPIRQIVLMVIVLCLVGALGYVALPTVAPIFFANPWLNGVIAAVFVFGVLACFWQLWQLIASVSWRGRSLARPRPARSLIPWRPGSTRRGISPAISSMS